MRIGVISDTHDNLLMIKKAVEVFNRHGVGMVVHAGDFIAPFWLMAEFCERSPKDERFLSMEYRLG